jgi:hypothetical protein
MTQLVRDHISRDLAEAFKQMADGVESGTITGAIFGLALRGRKYHVNVAGSLARDPTLARGVCAALDDELMGMVQGKASSDTTI